MGPYCQYCDRRCFVLRVLPADAKESAGKTILMATCAQGMEHSRATTGHTHETAYNPQEPAHADRIAAMAQWRDGWQAGYAQAAQDRRDLVEAAEALDSLWRSSPDSRAAVETRHPGLAHGIDRVIRHVNGTGS